MKIPELKNIITEFKNWADKLRNRLDTAEKKIKRLVQWKANKKYSEWRAQNEKKKVENAHIQIS